MDLLILLSSDIELTKHVKYCKVATVALIEKDISNRFAFLCYFHSPAFSMITDDWKEWAHAALNIYGKDKNEVTTLAEGKMFARSKTSILPDKWDSAQFATFACTGSTIASVSDKIEILSDSEGEAL